VKWIIISESIRIFGGKNIFIIFFQLNNSTVPNYLPIENWKKSRFLLKISNKMSTYLKIGILINRFVQFAGSETKQPGRNLSSKSKIVPNYPILR
jgi:hypothetical protein